MTPLWPRLRQRIFSRYFAVLFCLYLTGIFSIIRSNRSYLDDLGRSMYGYADWSAAARPLADLFSWFFYFGQVTVDASPLTQIIAVAVLAVTAMLLLEALRVRPSWAAVLCLVPVGLSPYGLENLSYKFDAPHMALAMLFAVLPCCFAHRAGRWHLPASALSLFASASLYQPALGCYLSITVYQCLVDLASRASFARVARRVWRLALPFLLGVGVYAAQARLWFSHSQYELYVLQHAILPPLSGLPAELAANIATYAHLLAGDWLRNGLGLLMGLLFLFFVLRLLARRLTGPRPAGSPLSFGLRMLLILLLLPCFLLTPFGIQFLLMEPVWTPRTFQGFGVMVSLMLLSLHVASRAGSAAHAARAPKGTAPAHGGDKGENGAAFPPSGDAAFFFALPGRAAFVVQALLAMQLLVFANVYGNLLDAQNRWELSRMSRLASDINRYIKETGSSRIFFVGSVGLSPLAVNPARKYPLLKRLVTVPLTRDWQWGYEQLQTFGVHVKRQPPPQNIDPASLTLFLETPSYRIDNGPDDMGVVTFLPPPEPKAKKKQPQRPKGTP